GRANKPVLRQREYLDRNGAVALTAGHAHGARQCRLQMPEVDHKVMAFRLTRNCLVDSRTKEFVALGRAQWTAQIGSIVLTKKKQECDVAKEENAIAR